MSTNTKLAEALRLSKEYADDEDWSRVKGCINLALAAHDAEQAQEPVLQDIEQYRMQMAGISTAALGYWKEGDGIHPDYDTVALRDVAKLYAKYDQLFQQKQAAQAVPAGFVPAFVLRNVLATLEHENTSGSAIQDTIWHSPGETLFDYIENSLEQFDAPAAPAPEAPTLTHELQQQCSDWGVYWRASDAHGVDLSIEQAEELLRRALGVEVAISKAAPQAQDSARTSPAHQPVHQPVHGWTDADADAARLALELECILLDPDTPMPLASRWWGSAHEALALHRQRLASEQSHGIGATTGEQHG